MSEENEEVVVTQEETDHAEKEAAVYGWVPLEKFRGNEDEWVDAETFVRRGKEINPILRKNNEILLKKLEQSQAEIVEVKKAAQEFREFQKQAAQQKVAEMEIQLNSLKQAKKDAINSGDGEQVIAIDDAIDELKEQREELKKKPEPAPNPAAEQVMDPVVKEWISEHDWFGVDRKKTRRANAIAEDVREDFPGVTGKAFFEKLDEYLEKDAEFAPKQARQNPVEGSSSGSMRSSVPTGKRTYNNLPSEAKQACDRYVKMGLLTKEQYVADYAWD
jgi:hypothetical protein